MIALDTNVVLRFLIRDDENQYIKVAQLLTDLETENEQAYISLMVLLEVAWVLSYTYQFERSQIIQAFLSLLTMPMLAFQSTPQLKAMLEEAKNNRFDLPDLLIAHHYIVENTTPVMTFDKRASKLNAFELIT